MKEGEAIESTHAVAARSKARSAKSRRTTSTSASTCSSTTTSRTTSARSSTSSAPSCMDSRRRQPTRSRGSATKSSTTSSIDTCRRRASRTLGHRGARQGARARVRRHARRSRAGSRATSTLDEKALRARIVAEVDQEYEQKVDRARRASHARSSKRASCCSSSTRTGASTSARMDYLRQGIHLRSYAQKNPKQEYKREAFELFSAMLDRVKHDTICDPVADPDPQARGRAGDRSAPAPDPRDPAVPACAQRRRHRAAARAEPGAEPLRDARSACSRDGRLGRAVRARAAEGRPQRTVSVRLGQEIQALPRPAQLTLSGSPRARMIHVLAGAASCDAAGALLVQRPPGKHLAGAGNFPAASCEAGETRSRRLHRELARSSASTSSRPSRCSSSSTAIPDKHSARRLAGARLSRRGAVRAKAQALDWVAVGAARGAAAARRPTCRSSPRCGSAGRVGDDAGLASR